MSEFGSTETGEAREQLCADTLRVLQQHRYAGWVAVEPFIYQPDGPACAARAIGYLRGLLEALEPAHGG